MSGYDYVANKSNNALLAERQGELPATAFCAWLKRWKQFAGVKVSDIKQVLEPTSWHHTSSRYNKTSYYSQLQLGEDWARIELRSVIAQRKQFEKLFRKHAVNKRLLMLMPDKKVWYYVLPSDKYDKIHLERIIKQYS